MAGSGGPPPISIFRGQARRGLGEGSGRAASHGEQFLAADPPYAGDPAALAELRPWLTFDASPEDRRRLGDRLVGYSYFRCGAHLVTACLRADGTFLDRPAYFSHGRAYAENELGRHQDPGVLIGDGGAFEASWRDRDRPPATGSPPLGSLPAGVAAAVENAPVAATRWLAALWQARRQGRPLLVEAPLEAFAAGGSAAELAGFARAALPRALGLACRTRVFTRYPGLFLARHQADFVVAPPAGPGELAAAPAHLMRIDFQGRPFGGAPLDDAGEQLAAQVVERFLHLPRGLVPFAARLDGFAASPTPQQAALVYNLAFALQSGQAADAEFTSYLRGQAARQGGEMPWHRLLAGADWDLLPAGLRHGLADAKEPELTLGERRLQAALLLERGAALLGERLADDDEIVELDRRRATDQLILAGAWRRWRERAAGQPAAFLRQAALAWLGSPLWRKAAAHATREDWKRALADLGPVTPKQLEELVRDGHPCWPWLPPFETDQLAELVERASAEAAQLLRTAAALDGVAIPAAAAPSAPAAAAAAPRSEAALRPAAGEALRRRRWVLPALVLAGFSASFLGWSLPRAFAPGPVPVPWQPPSPAADPGGRPPAPAPALSAAFAKLCDALEQSREPAVRAIFERHFRALGTLDAAAALHDPRLPAGLAELAALVFRRDPAGVRPAIFLQLSLFLPTFGKAAEPAGDGRTPALLLDFLRESLAFGNGPAKRNGRR